MDGHVALIAMPLNKDRSLIKLRKAKQKRRKAILEKKAKQDPDPKNSVVEEEGRTDNSGDVL